MGDQDSDLESSANGSMDSEAFFRVLAGAPAVAPDELDLTGQQLGHFKVLEMLGKGGMGVVYRARDLELRRDVALKVLPPDLVKDKQRRKRFLREARAAAAVNHANIAAIYAIGEEDDRIYIAMELVEGRSLRDEVAGGPLPLERALAIARGMLAGVRRAHRAGVVHRDLKPDNVMLDSDGEVKVLDFGLAKTPKPLHESSTKGGSLTTEEGQVMGTPGYMSPEQARGSQVDARTDVFAIGVILFEMLCGERPFTGDSAMEVIIATTRDEPPTPSSIRAQIPGPFDELILRCLAKDAADRYDDAGALLRALDELASEDAPAPEPVAAEASASKGGLVVIAIVVVAAAVFLATRGGEADVQAVGSTQVASPETPPVTADSAPSTPLPEPSHAAAGPVASAMSSASAAPPNAPKPATRTKVVPPLPTPSASPKVDLGI